MLLKYLYLYIILPIIIILSFSLYDHKSFFSNFTYDGNGPVRVVEDLEGTALIYGPTKSKKYRVNIGAEPSTSYPTVFRNQAIWPFDGAMSLLDRVPKRILFIGIGNGNQLISLKKIYPDAEIVIVELLDSLIEDMSIYGSTELKDLLNKSQIYVTDGRRYVQKIINKSAEKFDYIQIGVYRTTTAGAGNLFTREFLASLKKILSPDGVVSFNAYMPAVKAALEEYSNMVIMARSDYQVADVVMSNGSYINKKSFIKKYISTRNLIFTSLEKNKLMPYFSKKIPPNSFFIIGKKNIELILEDITTQTDDIIATEYFFTNRTKYKINGEDSRHWPLLDSAEKTEDISELR